MWRMTERRAAHARVAGKVIHPLLVLAILFLNYHNDPFCHRPGEHSFTYTLLCATLFVVAWDVIGRAFGAISYSILERTSLEPRSREWISSGVTTLVVGSGLFSVPFWIYQGYGGFLTANTVIDVSCMFTEGYMYAYALVVAPLLMAATLIREVITRMFHAPSAPRWS
jgi:hypothetical protein